MSWWETMSAVMVGVLWAQITYNLTRYSFKIITGYVPEQHPDAK